MTTNIDDVLGLFFDKLESDDEFFDYYGVDEDDALQLAKERASSYLKAAILELNRRVALDFQLGLVETDGNGTEFIEEITDDEADILSDIMVLKYYERGLAKLRPKINTFSASELKLLHSPANERATYLDMLNTYREHIREIVSRYAGKQRFTGEKRMVNHDVPDDSEE